MRATQEKSRRTQLSEQPVSLGVTVTVHLLTRSALHIKVCQRQLPLHPPKHTFTATSSTNPSWYFPQKSHGSATPLAFASLSSLSHLDLGCSSSLDWEPLGCRGDISFHCATTTWHSRYPVHSLGYQIRCQPCKADPAHTLMPITQRGEMISHSYVGPSRFLLFGHLGALYT